MPIVGASRTGSRGTGMVAPGWKPPAPKPIEEPKPYTPPPAPQSDPRIESLIREIQSGQNVGGSSRSSTTASASPKKLDLSGIEAQSAQLKNLLSQLMRGEGIQVSADVSGDPEARAFAVQRMRQAERAREDEASRLGASGVAGSGDFDGRAAQIREEAGTDIAAQRAGLVGRRREQALATAITGANLQLADLDRQARNKQAEFAGGVDLARLSESTQGQDAARQQRLLEVLLAEDARKRDSFEREREFQRAEEERALRDELLRQQVEQNRRTLAYSPSGGRYRGGVVIR